MHPLNHIAAGMWLLTAFSCLASADEGEGPKSERSTREASVDANEVLRRFVEELVVVTPGSNQFPESLEVGNRVLTPGDSFRVAAHETTQELYQLVTGGNPSRWRGPRNSAELMTYTQAEQFCVKLTVLLRKEQLIPDVETVRLPTDVEWEYACRAGSVETYCFGTAADLLDEYAWHTGNAAGNDPAVGELKPNQYGLYDVHGYLWEFVSVRQTKTMNANDRGSANVAMGGSWKDKASRLACDSRISVPVDGASDAIGFRCVVSGAPSQTKKAGER